MTALLPSSPIDDALANSMADTLWQAFGPPSPGYTGLRPYGDAQIDGFSLEGDAVFTTPINVRVEGWSKIANRLRTSPYANGRWLLSCLEHARTTPGTICDILPYVDLDYVVAEYIPYAEDACSTCFETGGVPINLPNYITRARAQPNTKVYIGFYISDINSPEFDSSRNLPEAYTLIKKYKGFYPVRFGGIHVVTLPHSIQASHCPKPSDVLFEFRRVMQAVESGLPWDPTCPARNTTGHEACIFSARFT
jgi:chitinase